MAEAVVFSLASNILATLASPAFTMVYEKGLSIWAARDELAKFRVTIETIKAVLLDAEKKQEGSAAVKNWIKRLKGVLFEADDLFDEVVTDDMLKQQMMMEDKNKLALKIHCSKLNPVISRNSIAKKVKAVRKSLLEISADMAQFEFVRCQNEERLSSTTSRQDPGSFVDAKAVIGRDADKNALLEMLFNEPEDAQPGVPLVIAILGIGGMGKTTLAQLIYNDEDVEKNFENKWFACISDISDEREVLGKMFQSVCEGSDRDLTVSQLQTKIRKSITGKKYLLVLDDVWEDHRGRWQDRMRLLNGGAQGSRIIVTTRFPSVVNAVEALRAHSLEGLSMDDSWYLFKRLAFVPDYDKDPRRESLGRKILKRCRCVPLSIWSIGSLLSQKNTIAEWEAIEKEGLPTLPKDYNDETMSVLKLSYDHLPSHLKHCFAYCSLFPKNYGFGKQELMYLWIAHGYIVSNNRESDFMHLLRRGFFQEARKDAFGEVQSCKMHDIMHDLALYVAGEESIMLNDTSSYTSSCLRHVSLVLRSQPNELWAIPESLLDCKGLRSFKLMPFGSICNTANLNKLFTRFKLLRTLSLSGLGIENIPSSIGELKLLRYVDLSYNDFEELPASMMNLVNLVALNLMSCCRLRVWPQDFNKLINIVWLNCELCIGLKQMPVGIEKLTELQHLSDLKVGKASELDALAGLLQQLRGKLLIDFSDGLNEDGDECSWKLPISLQQLVVWRYPGIRIPGWGDNGRAHNLARLEFGWCKKVKYLPPLRCLVNLRWLLLEELSELEFLEEEEISEDKRNCCIANSIILPRLEVLTLEGLPKLKGWWWWRKEASCAPAAAQIPLLSELYIYSCPGLELKSLPLCPHLRRLKFDRVDDSTPDSVIQPQQQELWSTIFYSSTSPPAVEDISIVGCKWVSRFQDRTLAFLRCLRLGRCCGLRSLHLDSAHLQTIEIKKCDELMSIELGEAPIVSLEFLKIQACKQLKILHIINAGALDDSKAGLRTLEIRDCPELELWDLQDQTWPRFDWDSLPALHWLELHPLPPPANLPPSLRRRQALGQLAIARVSVLDSQLNNDFLYM